MPSWYAIAALEDAREMTESLLVPVDRGRWLRLALIALFVGVGGGMPTGNANVPSGGGGGGGGGAPPGLPSIPSPRTTAALIVGVIVLVVALILLWSLVGAVMEFVLIVGLRDREIEIRRPFREHFRRGLRLFGFRLAIGLLSLLVIALPLLLFLGLGFGFSPIFLAFLLPLFVVFGLVAIVGQVVQGLTTDFVVPTMLTENLGVLDAWRRLWAPLRAAWKQVAVYVVAKFVLGIAVSIGVMLVSLLAALVVAIPFVIVGGGLFLALSAAGATTAGWVVVGLSVALFVLVMVVVGLLVQVPALTFVRYYSLSVLGMLVPELDLVGVERPDEGDENGESGRENGPDGDDGPDDGPNGAVDESGPTTTARPIAVPAVARSSR